MPDILRDVHRLHLIAALDFAQERLGPVAYFKDFTHYYFTRFLINVQHTFKQFATSEVDMFNHRHAEKLKKLLHYPDITFSKTIVPIPQGMMNSYRSTLSTLEDVLSLIHASSLEEDLQSLIQGVQANKLSDVSIQLVDKATFEDAKNLIAKLFGKTGLSHSTAGHVLPTADIAHVNTQLLEVTKTYYPLAFKLNQKLKEIETKVNQTRFSENQKAILSGLLMTMAYRLSLFAVVIDHVQGLEHNFVKSVETMLATA